MARLARLTALALLLASPLVMAQLDPSWTFQNYSWQPSDWPVPDPFRTTYHSWNHIPPTTPGNRAGQNTPGVHDNYFGGHRRRSKWDKVRGDHDDAPIAYHRVARYAPYGGQDCALLLSHAYYPLKPGCQRVMSLVRPCSNHNGADPLCTRAVEVTETTVVSYAQEDCSGDGFLVGDKNGASVGTFSDGLCAKVEAWSTTTIRAGYSELVSFDNTCLENFDMDYPDYGGETQHMRYMHNARHVHFDKGVCYVTAGNDGLASLSVVGFKEPSAWHDQLIDEHGLDNRTPPNAAAVMKEDYASSFIDQATCEAGGFTVHNGQITVDQSVWGPSCMGYGEFCGAVIQYWEGCNDWDLGGAYFAGYGLGYPSGTMSSQHWDVVSADLQPMQEGAYSIYLQIETFNDDASCIKKTDDVIATVTSNSCNNIAVGNFKSIYVATLPPAGQGNRKDGLPSDWHHWDYKDGSWRGHSQPGVNGIEWTIYTEPGCSAGKVFRTKAVNDCVWLKDSDTNPGRRAPAGDRFAAGGQSLIVTPLWSSCSSEHTESECRKGGPNAGGEVSGFNFNFEGLAGPVQSSSNVE